MKKNIYIDLISHFGTTVSVQQLRSGPKGVTMRHAERIYYQSGQHEAILQEFDGRNGYLYSIEMDVDHALDIPIRSERPDLHILYLMSGTDPLCLFDATSATICKLPPTRSCYLYLPAGDYILHVPSGWTNLFGFYFDGGIFRDGNEKEFPFLDTVLANYRRGDTRAVASIDFRVGPRTRSAIRYLCSSLHKGRFSNEKFLSKTLHGLVELSKEKVQQEPPYDLKAEYVRAARERIEQEIEDGHGIPLLDIIASDLHVSLNYLNRLHQQRHGISLRTYIQHVLARVAVDMLRAGTPPLRVCYHLNYNSPSAFSRFVKKQTGKTPKQWHREPDDQKT